MLERNIQEEIRQSIELHVNLTEEEYALLFQNFTVRKLQKRQYLLQQGDPSRHLSYIKKGCLRSFEIDQSGKEHIIQFSIEGWWAGDILSNLTQEPSQLNIECLENCEILQIESAKMEEMYLKIPKLERYFRIITQNAFVVAQNRLLSVMSKSALERYLEFAARYPLFMQRIPSHHIASYLGITPESLSRLRKKYANKMRAND